MNLFKRICLGKYRSHEWSEGQLEEDALYGETQHAIGRCHKYHFICIRCGAKKFNWQMDYFSNKPLVFWRPKANLAPNKVNPVVE